MPREGTLREQKPEAGLLEVVIRGNGVGQVAFANLNHAHTTPDGRGDDFYEVPSPRPGAVGDQHEAR